VICTAESIEIYTGIPSATPVYNHSWEPHWWKHRLVHNTMSEWRSVTTGSHLFSNGHISVKIPSSNGHGLEICSNPVLQAIENCITSGCDATLMVSTLPTRHCAMLCRIFTLTGSREQGAEK